MPTGTRQIDPTAEPAPRLVRRAGYAALGLVLTGSAYLIWARGEAMIVDLATLGAKVWCF
ncbi:MAG: hypothetical protein AB7E81_15600 [Hyphomicrobiaceae bacterium]